MFDTRRRAPATQSSSLIGHDRRQNAARAVEQEEAALRPLLTSETALPVLVKLVPQAIKSQSSKDLSALLDTINGLYSLAELKTAAKLYQDRTGRSLHNDLMKAFDRWLDVRRAITNSLTQIGPHLAWHGFVEQVTYGGAYSNKDDLSDAKGADGTTNLKELVKQAGFRASPVIRGRQGLQFREFTPIPGKAIKQIPITTYRGTEGVKVLPWETDNPLDPKNREGLVDTYIGDLTRMGAGYPQVVANMQLIERRLKALGKSVMAGHSLGGAIAQIVTAKLPQYAAECITFAAPGINKADAESLKGKKIPTTHHRNAGDIVPMGNSEAAPGTIITYERYTRAQNDSGWLPSKNPGTNHNNMPIRGLLNYQNPSRLLPIEQALLDKGVSGPTDADHNNKVISVVSSVVPTSQDPVFHAGERALNTGYSTEIFMVNLGYNIALERAEHLVRTLDPKKLPPALIRRRLDEYASQLAALRSLPMSQEAFDLSRQMGLPTFLKPGAKVDIRPDDAQLVAFNLTRTWRAWWSETQP